MAENMKTLSGNRFYDFFIISVLFIISTIIRMYNYADMSVYPDELYYSSYAYSIIIHNFAWPPEYMVCQPPLFPYILATCTYFFEGGLDVFRVVPIFFGSLTVCVIYFLGKSLYNRRVGILAAILLCFCSFYILFSRIVMLEAIWILVQPHSQPFIDCSAAVRSVMTCIRSVIRSTMTAFSASLRSGVYSRFSGRPEMPAYMATCEQEHCTGTSRMA